MPQTALFGGGTLGRLFYLINIHTYLYVVVYMNSEHIPHYINIEIIMLLIEIWTTGELCGCWRCHRACYFCHGIGSSL